MGREVRMVPPDWQHPKTAEGNYQPLFERDEYMSERLDDPENELTEADFMPDFGDKATHYCMYENVSEGTPISPPFATPEDLAGWLADTGASAFAGQTADYEHWLRVAKGGYAPTMAIQGGQLMSGVSAFGEEDAKAPNEAKSAETGA